jgi:hypothetical protein
MPPDPTDKFLNWPAYWFTRLEEALHAGDFEQVAEAGRELRRLGVRIAYPRPVQTDRREAAHA